MHNTDHNKQRICNDAPCKWEYKVIRCQNLLTYFDDEKEQASLILGPRPSIKGQKVKLSEKAANPWPLDPAIPLPRNESISWFLAWNEKHKYWTWPITLLNELGEDGWEVATVTPPWNYVVSYSSGYGNASIERHPNIFDIFMKRHKT